MGRVRIAGATVNQLPLDWEGNQRRLQQLLSEARQLGVQLLCLPELCTTGYGCEDAFMSPELSRRSESMVQTLLASCGDMVVVFGVPLYHRGAMYNCAVVVQNGKVLGLNPKQSLAREGCHYEPRWFRPWPKNKYEKIDYAGFEQVPMGKGTFRFGEVGVAVEICEEAWGPVPGAAAAAHAVEIVVNLSASHFALGKYRVREQLVANSSRAMQCYYLYTNLVGLEAGRVIYDGGVLIARRGEIVMRGPRFGFSDGTITHMDVNLDEARVDKLRNRSYNLDDADLQSQPPIIQGLPWSTLRSPIGSHLAAGINHGGKGKKDGDTESSAALSPEREFLYAQTLGLFDYLRKSHSQGYVVSLSGGRDSATTAVLVAQMIACALADLGAKELAARLQQPKLAELGDDPRRWIPHILTCIYQSTEFSSAATRQAAKDLATELGARFFEADIEGAKQFYVQTAEQLLGRKLDWQNDDTALQNVQARARAPLAWLIANLQGAILLTTSNRSEAAVGYATMDGDMAGGLAPLSGIDKPFICRWLQWASSQCQLGLGSIAALRQIDSMPPTAELRPGHMQQTDEGDLMPYAILDAIERHFVRDKLPVPDIFALLKSQNPQVADESLHAYIQKFMRLWAASQWKREKMAPGFHMDDENLDPRSWMRYPILSAPVR